MKTTTDYLKVINYLCKTSPNFKNKYNEMVESLPEEFKTKFTEEFHLDYYSKGNEMFDCNNGENYDVSFRFFNIATLENKFHLNVGSFNEVNFSKLIADAQPAAEVRGKFRANGFKIAELDYCQNANSLIAKKEGVVSVYLINTESGYVIYFEEMVQSKLDCNHYELVGEEVYEISENEVRELFNIKNIKSSNLTI